MKPSARTRLLAATLALLAASPAIAQPTKPPVVTAATQAKFDAHRSAGNAHYEASNLAAAMAEFRAAHALIPDGALLYSMALIESDRGDCAASIALYKRFLDTRPSVNATKAANDAIAECEAKLAASGAVATVEEAPPAEPAKPVPPPVERDPIVISPATRTVQRPFYTDPIGDALVGAGAVGLITGGVFYLLARRDVAKADEGGPGGISLPEYQRLATRAEDRQRYAAIAAGVGGALVIGGVIRYAIGDRRETIVVSPAVHDGGASVTLGLRF